MAAMTKYDVSYAYPFITAGLTLVTVFMAILMLGESVNIYKISGLFLVVTGVVVLGFAKQ
jgi:multidrug transporter EmrE-like cation transporter